MAQTSITRAGWRLVARTIGLFTAAMLIVGCAQDDAALPDFTRLVEQSGPAIVNISGRSEAQAAGREEGAAPPWFEWFRDFGAEPESQQQQPRQSLGSGFILTRDGEILTNNHVVAEADEITVTLADRRQFQAKVIGRDAASDLALLKIDASGLPVLKWGSSDALKVGEWVLAIGSPFGFEQTVTAGIVSGKRRALASEQYVPFLQTDVAINPGNSGGPLFNLDGEVVGINSQIFSQTGGYMGLSFSIPSDTALNVVEQLRKHGKVRRAWLGVVIQQVDRALAESFGLDHATGALVSQIEPQGPADEAGLKAGDIILKFDDEAITDSRALPPLVGRHAPGDKVRIELLRDGRRSSLRAELGELPDEKTAPQSADWTGLQLEPLSDRLAARLRVDGGLVVRGMAPRGAGAASGLRPGDVILGVAGVSIDSEADFQRVISALGRGESAALLVLRDERTLFIALQRPEE